MPVSVLTVLVAAVVITIGVVVYYKAKLRSSARPTMGNELQDIKNSEVPVGYKSGHNGSEEAKKSNEYQEI